VSMLPCGQSRKAAMICAPTAPESRGTGGFPVAPFGWDGVVLVSSVRPTTIPAATIAATATVR